MEKDNEQSAAVSKAIRQFLGDKGAYSPGDKEIVIRTGKAEEISKPLRVVVSGILSAPRSFYEKRKSLHDPNKCHVTVDRLNGKISLYMDEVSEFGSVISGSIQPNPELEAFQINKQRMFGIKEMMDLLKFNRVHFQEKEVNAKIVTELQNFKAKVLQEIENVDDNRGKTRKILISNLEHKLEASFALNIPIFKGTTPATFVVDVCVKIAETGDVNVWLESRELKELQVKDMKKLLDGELSAFTDIVVMEV